MQSLKEVVGKLSTFTTTGYEARTILDEVGKCFTCIEILAREFHGDKKVIIYRGFSHHKLNLS